MWHRILIILLLLCIPTQAADIHFAWDANSEPDLTGYKLYRGSQSRIYTNSVTLGKITDYVWTVPDGSFYYALTAFNPSAESGYSNEVFYATTVQPPAPATGVNVLWSEVGQPMSATFRNIATSTDDATCNKPTGTTTGDLLVAHVFTVSDEVLTPPTGWTEHVSRNETLYGDYVLTFKIFSKVAGGSEPASYTWTGYSGIYIDVVIAAYSGMTSPVFDEASALSESISNGNTIVANTVTTDNDNGLIVYSGINIGTATWTSPSGVTERVEWDDGSFFSDEVQSVAGASTSRTFTRSVTSTDYRAVLTACFKDSVVGVSIPVLMNQYRQRR